MYTKDIQNNKAEGLDKYQLPDTSQLDFGSYLTAKDSKPKKEKDTRDYDARKVNYTSDE